MITELTPVGPVDASTAPATFAGGSGASAPRRRARAQSRSVTGRAFQVMEAFSPGNTDSQ